MLPPQKHLFDLPNEVSYLNCAYMSPILKKTAEAGIRGVNRKRLPYEISPVDFFTEVELLRKSFARIINATDFNQVTVAASASYAIANAVKNISIKKGQHVILVGEEFPSNYYSWERKVKEVGASLKIISPDESHQRGKKWNQKILDAIDSDTAAISLGHVHWADGTLFDLANIREKTTAHNAAMVVDASQSLGALPLDIQEIAVDALISVTYKWLFGPYGTSLAYYGPYFDNGIPIEESWMNRKDSENFKNLVNYQPEYQPSASRYGVGEASNFCNMPMAVSGINQVEEWGVANIQAYAKNLSTPFLDTLKNMGCQLEEEAWTSSHLRGIRFSTNHFDHDRLLAAFAKRQVYTSMRGNAVRVSTEVFNVAEDWEKLVECFRVSRK